jgi:hypothetical protein
VARDDISDAEWAQFQRGLTATGYSDEATSSAGVGKPIVGPSSESELKAYVELARQHLAQTAPYAAATITQLARNATNERVKLDAAKYVLERTMGPVGQVQQGAKPELESFLDDLVTKAETYANDNR